MSKQHLILGTLKRNGIYRICDVVQETQLERDQCARLLDTLARNGLVERIPGEGNGRKWLYRKA